LTTGKLYTTLYFHHNLHASPIGYSVILAAYLSEAFSGVPL